MNPILVEFIAFIISIVAFIYGLLKICNADTSLYFKLIVNAVGCYVLEELWSIINGICGFENGFVSIRLIGIFGCFCTFLTASISRINKKNSINKLAFIAPVMAIILFTIYASKIVYSTSMSHIIISFIVILPLIIDSYFELNSLLISKDIKSINVLILIEYLITLSYLFIQSVNIKLIMDILSAVIMAFIVFECRRSSKCKILI